MILTANFILGLLAVGLNCQQTFPYISFHGQVLLNHSYVDGVMIGDVQNNLACHTDLETCCSRNEGNHRGDWYFPSGGRLPFSGSRDDIIEHRENQMVQLRRLGNLPQSGIYRCDIPTVAVHITGDMIGEVRERQRLYVGIYTAGEGNITILSNIEASPIHKHIRQFTLTCISTGGPATNVTWITDSSTVVTNGTQSVLSDSVTLQYIHTLVASTVGVYSCLVANNKPSSSMATITIGELPPTNLSAIQHGHTSIIVSWISPSPIGDITGFKIVFKGESNNGTVEVSSDTSSVVLVNLRSGETYTIFLYSISQGVNVPTVAGPVGLAPFLAPIISSLVAVTTTEITITISIPPSTSIVTGFIVEQQRNTSVGCSDLNSSTIHVDGVFDEYNVTGLEPGNQYSVRVRATNEAGSGSASNSIRATTIQEAPSGPPLLLRQGTVTPNTITIHWEEVDCSEQNGEIKGYNVSTIKDGEVISNKSVAGHMRKAEITNLLHSTSYTVRVAAFNGAGVGPHTDIMIETEGEVALYATTFSTSVTLWWILEQTLSAMEYTISYHDTDRNCATTIRGLPGIETGFTLSDLEEATEYSVTVTALFSDGRRQGEDNITITTQESTPSAPPIFVRLIVRKSSEMEVQWGPLNCRHHNGEITGYSVRYGIDGAEKNEETMVRVSGDPVNGGMFNLTNLLVNTEYRVQVAAETRAGIGVYSREQVAVTLDNAYMSLNGVIIPNHGYVLINDIGSNDHTALLCHTNRPPDNRQHSGGDWYSPNGTRVHLNDVHGFTKSSGPMLVRLSRTTSMHDTPEGLYCCSVRDKNLAIHKLYVGIYNRGYGNITLEVLPPVQFSDNVDTVTLTCISFDGPATTVTWTKDSATNITEGTETQFNADTKVYHHYLNTTEAGQYLCRVENYAFSTFANVTLQKQQPPEEVKVEQNGLGTVLVSWSLSNAEGYRLKYGIGRDVR